VFCHDVSCGDVVADCREHGRAILDIIKNIKKKFYLARI
jgi:hypothetical protein